MARVFLKDDIPAEKALDIAHAVLCKIIFMVQSIYNNDSVKCLLTQKQREAGAFYLINLNNVLQQWNYVKKIDKMDALNVSAINVVTS